MGVIGASAEKGACGLGSGLRDLGDKGHGWGHGAGDKGHGWGLGVSWGPWGVWWDLGGVAWFGRVGCKRQQLFAR
jgi:hypothetical protein